MVVSAACSDPKFDVQVGVAYPSNHAGGCEAVLLFVTPPMGGLNGTPQKQKIAFESVYVGGCQQQTVSFRIDPCEHLATVKGNGIWSMDTGIHILSIGEALAL